MIADSNIVIENVTNQVTNKVFNIMLDL